MASARLTSGGGLTPPLDVRHMVADRATRGGADQGVMACEMSRHPADDGALHTSRLSNARRQAQT